MAVPELWTLDGIVGFMFTCANCKKEKSDEERGSVGFLGSLGLIVIAPMPWCPADACKDCTKQVRLFGLLCVIILALAVVVYAVGRRWL
jgi:hypothetical protein